MKSLGKIAAYSTIQPKPNYTTLSNLFAISSIPKIYQKSSKTQKISPNPPKIQAPLFSDVNYKSMWPLRHSIFCPKLGLLPLAFPSQTAILIMRPDMSNLNTIMKNIGLENGFNI